MQKMIFWTDIWEEAVIKMKEIFRIREAIMVLRQGHAAGLIL
jgi:hypothetical protein